MKLKAWGAFVTSLWRPCTIFIWLCH